MIKLVFTINREIFRIDIADKMIWYNDRMWKRAIRLIPKDEEFIKKIKISRNRIPHHLISLFSLTDEEQEEYNLAKTDRELAEICKHDVQIKGAKLIGETID